MKTEIDENIRKLQLEEIDILKEFIRICEENNLKYYALGGTLLGAVRHKGFIPWDDDIDVAMPRDDYEKFLRLSSNNFKDGYELDHYCNNSEYKYSWGRLIKKNMKIINHSSNIPREEYVWIDIIPLDGFPDGGIKKFIHVQRLKFWWNLNQIIQFDEMVDQKRKRSAFGSFCVKSASIVSVLFRVFDYRKCLIKLNKILSKYPYYSDTEYVINYLAAYGFDEKFKRTDFSSQKKYPFEDFEICGPVGYDGVLKTIYGDYMTLPPIDERNKHNSEIVFVTKGN